MESVKIFKHARYSYSMPKKFHVIIEKDEDGIYVGKVLELDGCITQGNTIDKLMDNVKDAIKLCLEVEQEEITEFIGVREVTV